MDTINTEIDNTVGKGSWIQKIFVVGAFFVGMVMCFFKQIVLQLIASYLDIDYSNISKSGFLRQVFMPFPMIDKNQSVLY